MKNRRNKEFKIWRSTDSEQHKLNFLQSREELESYDKYAYERYVRKSTNKIKSRPREFWNCLDYKRSTKGYPSSMTYNNDFAHNTNDACKLLFKNFFETVYERPQEIDHETFSEIPNEADELTDIVIDRDCVLLELNSLDHNKGPGPGGIPKKCLKMFAGQLAEPLMLLFNKSLSVVGYFPKN